MSPTWHHKCLQSQETSRYTNAQSEPHLDLIIMENSEEYQVEKIIPGPNISDHWFITMQYTEHKFKVQQLLTKHRKLSDDIVKEFDKHFNNQPILKATNLDEAINQLICEMQRTLDQIVPEKTKKMQNRKKHPWFDNELYDQRRIMKNKESVWLEYSNPSQWKAYTRERNRFNTMLKYKKTSLFPHWHTTK